MDPNVFRKGDAPSCLVVDKSWNEIVGKPDFFDELAERIVRMMDAADDFGLLTRATTLRQFKDAVNEILLRPLQYDYPAGEDIVLKGSDTILVDAFWDEIRQDENTWVKFKDAITRAYDMKGRIAEHKPLTNKDMLQSSKDNFNETIVKPLCGINEDE